MLKIYKIDTNYNNYLMQFDINVKDNSENKNKRPYIGVLFQINNIKYFAPMTSPKPKHLTMHNSIDFEKINNGVYGAINFNNMIPVEEKYINIININSITDIKYKILLINQYNYINKRSDKLIHKAKSLYNLIKFNKANQKLKNRCVNFTLLEEKCKEYSKNLSVSDIKTDLKTQINNNLDQKNEIKNNTNFIR